MTLRRCCEIADEIAASMPDMEAASAPYTPNKTVDLYLHQRVPIDDHTEPMLAVFANGSWQVAYDGDTEWMSDGAPADNPMVNAIPMVAVIGDFLKFMRQHVANQIEPE